MMVIEKQVRSSSSHSKDEMSTVRVYFPDADANAKCYQPELDLIYHESKPDKVEQPEATVTEPETKIGELALNGRELVGVEA